jgi:flagellar motor protein MotB
VSALSFAMLADKRFREASFKIEEARTELNQVQQQTESAKEELGKTYAQAAESDRRMGDDLWNQKRHREAIAHWVRSLSFETPSTSQIEKIVYKTLSVGWPQQLLSIPAENFATFSPDGKLLATYSNDKIVRIRDARTGVVLFTLEGHTDEVNLIQKANRFSQLRWMEQFVFGMLQRVSRPI